MVKTTIDLDSDLRATLEDVQKTIGSEYLKDAILHVVNLGLKGQHLEKPIECEYLSSDGSLCGFNAPSKFEKTDANRCELCQRVRERKKKGEEKQGASPQRERFSYEWKYGVELMEYMDEKRRIQTYSIVHCPKLPNGETCDGKKLPCFLNFDGVRITCDDKECPFIKSPWYHNMMKRNFLLLKDTLLNKYIEPNR